MKKIHNQQIPQKYRTIWNTVRQIPKGMVATYGEVAELSDLPRQARLVGYALHALPKSSPIPWHRVVNARGTVSFPKQSASYKRQIKLLKAEGIRFSAGRIDLERFGVIAMLQKKG